MITLQMLAKALGGEISGNQLRCPGPGHSAADRSLNIKLDSTAPDGFVVHSFAGDDPIVCKDYVRNRAGLPAFRPNGNGKQHRASDDAIAAALMAAVQSQRAKRPQGRVVAVFDYTEADGALLYQVLKYDPKGFSQRRPDGKGGWIWNLDGVRHVLYRWPELIKYPDATIFVCEGEKDAGSIAALDLCSTTVASGKWTTDCIQALAGRHVYIIQDVDKNGAGDVKAHKAAALLHPVAASVRVVKLPGLDGGEGNKDVTNWLEQGHTKDELIDVCAGAQYWEPTETNEGDGAPEKPVAKPEIRPKLVFIDTSRWDDEPPPPREWAVFDRIPLRQTALFSGEGAAGKSSILLQECIAHPLAKDWLGTLPEPGPSFFIDCEDDDKELWRRSAAVIEHYQSTFQEAINGGLYLKSYAGADAVMATVSQKGKVEPTAIYNEILEAAGDLKPKMIGIASSANVFAGKESDRAQVQQFIGMLTRIAIVANGGVTLVSHPSLTGITSDSGLSGTTQWHNAVRARFYIKSVNPEPGEQPDTDLREIIFKKNNYGPISASIVLRYQRGLFLPVAGVSTLERAAQEQTAENIFLDLLKRFTAANRKVSDRPGPGYAPTAFAREDEAKRATLNSKSLEAAMRRLFKAEKIWNEPYGRPSRPYHHIALKT